MMPGRIRVPRDLMLAYNEPRDREIQRFFAAIEARVNETNALEIEDIPTSFTDGSVYFAESGFTAEDNANLFWDNTLKQFSVNVPSGDRCCEFNMRGTSHFQTGSLLDTDGIIVRPSPLSFIDIGAPIPQITGEVAGGVTGGFSMSPGLFLSQDPTDFLFSKPTLLFTDNVGTGNTLMLLEHDPSTIVTRIENTNVVHFAQNSRRKTFTGMGNWGSISDAAVPTSWLHLRDEATGTDHLLHLESGTSGDVAQRYTRGTDKWIDGIDDSDDQSFVLSYSDVLGTNNVWKADKSGDFTVVNNLKGLNRAKQYFYAGF